MKAALPLLLACGMAGAAPAALEGPGQAWLIDHTRSDLGGEFYRAFASAWRSEARGDLVISVDEQIVPPFAYQLTVSAGQRTLAQARLYPGQRDDIPRQVERAVASASARLRDWAVPGAAP